MAIFNLSCTVEDAKGQKASYRVAVPRGALTLSAITTFWQQQMTRADLILDAKIVSAGVSIGIALPGGIKAAAVAGNDYQEGGLFSFNCAGTDRTYGVWLPGLKEALFVGEAVDTSDADVISWLQLMQTGYDPGSGVIQPSNEYEFDITSLAGAVKRFRK